MRGYILNLISIKYYKMKKIFLSVAVVSALILASCGGPSVCDCVKNDKAEKKDEAMTKKCKEKNDKASDEEKKKMEEEAEKCK